MKKLITLTLTAWLLLTLAWCNNQTIDPQKNIQETQKPKTEEIIKIGYIWPLTWDAASIGQIEKNSINMFLEENPNWWWKKVKVIYEDWQCNGQQASSVAQKLVNIDKVKLILWWLCSSETLSSAPITEKWKVILFSSLSTSPDVSSAWDFVFRNAPSDEFTTDVVSKELESKFSKVALITVNSDFAQAYRKKIKEKYKWEFVLDEVYNQWETNFKTVIEKIKSSKSEAILFVNQTPTEWWFMAKQLKEYWNKLPTYMADACNWPEFFDIAKDWAEWIKIWVFDIDKNKPEISAFYKKYKNKYNEEPSYWAYMLLHWDALNILKNAIETVWYDWEKIRDYLYSMPTYKGIAWEYKFDQNWDAPIMPSILVAKNGKFEFVK